MKIIEFTSKGNRKENQDFIAYKQIGDDTGIFVVADGMGGYAKGVEAAQVCAEAIVEYLEAHWHDKVDDDEKLRQAFIYANESLSFKRFALGVKKMGCCLVASLVKDGVISFIWLGDTRGYLFRNGDEIYRTTDHSIVNELAKIKSLRAEDIEKYSNVVTRSMMGDDNLGALEIEKHACLPGDIVFLCSDGLHKEIEPERIIGSDSPMKAMLADTSSRFEDNLTYLEIQI